MFTMRMWFGTLSEVAPKANSPNLQGDEEKPWTGVCVQYAIRSFNADITIIIV